MAAAQIAPGMTPKKSLPSSNKLDLPTAPSHVARAEIRRPLHSFTCKSAHIAWPTGLTTASTPPAKKGLRHPELHQTARIRRLLMDEAWPMANGSAGCLALREELLPRRYPGAKDISICRPPRRETRALTMHAASTHEPHPC